MRYRFFEGNIHGSQRRVLVFETDAGVFRYQMSRVAFNPLPVGHIEEVDPTEFGFTGPVTQTKVETAPEVDPHRVFMEAPAHHG